LLNRREWRDGSYFSHKDADFGRVPLRRSNFKNIDTLDLGPGIFMVMEDNPHEMGDGIFKWFKAKVA
jgi:hypothetical protein